MTSPVNSLRERRLARLRGLYAIAGATELALACARGGARVLQLRIKGAPAGELLRAARACREAGALLIVDDRPDVAALCGADGVHLGQDDLGPADARAVLGPDALIGVSTHSEAEIDAALAAGADYLGFGPIFATRSKPGAPLPPPHGVEGLSRAVKRARGRPVVAIGGLTVQNAPLVAAAGAACAAALAELREAADPEAKARAFAEAFIG